MNVVRYALNTANMPLEYWPAAMANVSFKQNLLVHETTGLCPYNVRERTAESLPKMFTFRQFG